MKRALGLAALAVAFASSTALAQQVTVKIGVLSDMSSLYADIGGPGSVAAAKLAVADFNATNKDVKVEIVSGDHQNKPDVGSSIANQWIDVEKVDLIVDTPNSGVALAVNEIIRGKNKVFINSGAASSDLTGAKCSPNTVHWTYDTWMLANGTGKAIVKTGGDTWFFLTADYAFGHALERDTSAVVEKNGGKVVGKVRHPLNTNDFSSFLLQAQTSKAKIIGMANAGGDTINTIKSAAEFGISWSSGVRERRERARSRDRAGPDAHRDLVLGSERREPRLDQEVGGGARRLGQVPDDDPCRRLRGRDALPQGSRGAEERR
jgi:branched-chain amino acid transport system substrate-binding protein